MTIPQIIAAIGGTSVLIYVLLAVLAPGILTILTPIINNLVSAFAALVRYLWGAFLYVSQSVPAMFLLVCVAIFALNVGVYKGTAKTWTKVHKDYTLLEKKKPKAKPSSDTIFTNPLNRFK